jgi:hypothetical protein
MTSSPQPLQVRRRSGAKRGDHGTYVAPEAATPAAEPPSTPAPSTAASEPSGSIGTDRPRSAGVRGRRVGKPITDAAAAAKAAYDAKPKVIVRGVDEDVYFKLRAIYKHQLRSPDGIEGWSEFGRQLLRDYVEKYEQAHGEMTGGEDVELPAGRRLGQ